MRIAFIGLGNMGAGMARRLIEADHVVTIYNRTRSKAEEIANARIASSPKEAVREVDLVMTMLADDRATEDVTFGEQGLLAGLAKGALHASMSTISIALADRLEQEHAKHGSHYVGSPVFGRPEAAASGKLFILAAGAAAQIEKARPAFDAIAQKVITIGEKPREAHLTKIIGNFMLMTSIEAMAESLALARKSGLDAQTVLDALTGTVFQAPFFKAYGSMIVDETYEKSVGFAMPLALKDVGLALKASDAVRAPLPIASLLRDQLISGIGRGGEKFDMSALGKYAAENAGLTPAKGK